jgi:hypothetical protein
MRTDHRRLASMFLMAGCASGQGDSQELEAVASVEQELCFVPSAPPAGFTATVSRSLDDARDV